MRMLLLLAAVPSAAAVAAVRPLSPFKDEQVHKGGYGCAAGAVRCTWERTYGGALEDKAYGVAALPDGGAVVAGHWRSRSDFSYAAWILRLSRSGFVLWEKWVDGGAHVSV